VDKGSKAKGNTSITRSSSSSSIVCPGEPTLALSGVYRNLLLCGGVLLHSNR
jgi:hypothetical protein